jgi:hypothetical protein
MASEGRLACAGVAEQDETVLVRAGQHLQDVPRGTLRIGLPSAVQCVAFETGRKTGRPLTGVHEPLTDVTGQFHGRRVGPYGGRDEHLVQADGGMLALLRGDQDLQVQAAVGFADARGVTAQRLVRLPGGQDGLCRLLHVLVLDVHGHAVIAGRGGLDVTSRADRPLSARLDPLRLPPHERTVAAR